MRVLFIHQNCPGQYKHLARLLGANPKNEVVFITQPGKPAIPGVTQLRYKPKRQPATNTHFYIRNLEGGILLGQAVARAALTLKGKGFAPDIVCAHPSWGEALYIKDVFPNAPLLNYCEFYYRAKGSDVGFEQKRPISIEDLCRVRTRNGINLLSLEACDAGISPTRWQKSQFPKEFRYKLGVIHDGIDTAIAAPDPQARLRLPNGRMLTRRHEVVTYVARNLEPYRGFPTFMRAVAESCRRRPHCHYVILGGDDVSYGRRLPDGRCYREKLLSELVIDPDRVHFLGKVPYDQFIKVLQVSSAHVYLTYPFVLSWSVLEAMSAGCLVIGSNTAPVTEVIRDGENGLLTDFFSPNQIADRIDEVLDHDDGMAEIRAQARETVIDRYELQHCLRRHLRLLERLCNGQRPQPAAPRSTARKR